MGEGQRTQEIADHANVFMVKGLFRQWKQPICYTFTGGPHKSHSLKDLIKVLIEKCHNIGLKIMTTVCDQGGANQAAINQLIKERQESCLKNGTEDKFFGFLVNNAEVIPLYDVPHLFKGLRNNLLRGLTKDLFFTINNKKYMAKWAHIEQFYYLDTEEQDIRICPKLSDQHVLCHRINKLKVKCCTQVFSHQVGALMKKIISWSKYSLIFLFT